MADTQDQQIQELIGRADEAVRIAQRSIEEGEDKLRALGLDPANVRAALDAQPLTAEQRAEAQALFRQDMEAIQSQADQEAAYARQRSEPRASAGAAKRPRNLV